MQRQIDRAITMTAPEMLGTLISESIHALTPSILKNILDILKPVLHDIVSSVVQSTRSSPTQLDSTSPLSASFSASAPADDNLLCDDEDKHRNVRPRQ